VTQISEKKFLVLEMSTAFSNAYIFPFPMYNASWWRVLCHGNGSADQILTISSAQENREMFP
jgi:hypothetical protein